MRKNHLASLISLITAASTSVVAQDEDSPGFALEEVLVTAQFKQETLQDAGLAIDVVDGAEITKQGISSGIDLADSVPALTINNTGGSSVNLILRGVGNTSNGPSTDAAVTFNYDGVALARGAGAFGALFDLERVEVLKGPQGTLYGRNSTGGVVSVVPAKPQIGEFTGFIDGSVGNYSALDTTFAVNLPLGEIAAFRLAANAETRDGYYTDGSNDVDKQNVRAQVLIEPSDVFSVRLAADYGNVGGSGASSTPYAVYTNETGTPRDFT
ncbi:MAG: TonB-dependent receptor plug domain-containing protein, partial [Cellvibrionaceae bacterium]|nr:TonB-dependent receptor plug domain-containing protein [Cellvibrionaceae bacterium]